GTLTFLVYFPLDPKLREGSVAALAGVALFVGIAVMVIRSGATPFSTLLAWVLRAFNPGFHPAAQKTRVGGPGSRHHERERHLIERVRSLEMRIYSFYGRHRRKLLPLLAMEGVFHLAGIAEVYVTISLISPAPITVVHALILESIGRIIN